MSLPHSVVDEDGTVDFLQIASLEGVYIAQIFDSNFIQKSLTQGIQNSNNKKKKTINIEDYSQTKITHDKGGVWKSIKAPDFDSNGKAYNCKQCNLHFNMHTQSHRFGPVYSHPRAVGHIIATGSVGSHLN